MRTLSRNKSTFYFAPYLGKFLLFDEDGNSTGEHETKYGFPVCCRANISPASGRTVAEQFGATESYDKVIVTDNLNLPINEFSLLWVDTAPVFKNDGTVDTPHDYIVKKVSRSLNSVSYAITKVDVNAD